MFRQTLLIPTRPLELVSKRERARTALAARGMRMHDCTPVQFRQPDQTPVHDQARGESRQITNCHLQPRHYSDMERAPPSLHRVCRVVFIPFKMKIAGHKLA